MGPKASIQERRKMDSVMWEDFRECKVYQAEIVVLRAAENVLNRIILALTLRGLVQNRYTLKT